MRLSDVATLAQIGETREYQTLSMKEPRRVVIVSAEVNIEGRLFITVRPEGQSGGYFRVRAASLSMPEPVAPQPVTYVDCDPADDAARVALAKGICPECETATCQRRPGYPYCTGDAAAYLARKAL
jgi:hypothetical protein